MAFTQVVHWFLTEWCAPSSWCGAENDDDDDDDDDLHSAIDQSTSTMISLCVGMQNCAHEDRVSCRHSENKCESPPNVAEHEVASDCDISLSTDVNDWNCDLHAENRIIDDNDVHGIDDDASSASYEFDDEFDDSVAAEQEDELCEEEHQCSEQPHHEIGCRQTIKRGLIIFCSTTFG